MCRRREPQTHEFWSFVSGGITSEFHLTVQEMSLLEWWEISCPVNLLKVGVRFLFLAEFPLMEMLNGWAFLTSTEPVSPFGDDNLLSPRSIWRDGGTITNKNWGIQPGGP